MPDSSIIVSIVSDLPEWASRLFPVSGCAVSVDGTFHAVDDTCSHDRWSLCDGYVEGEEIVCSLHLARFNLLNGEATLPPAYEPLKVYPVKIEGDDVLVDVDAGELKAS